MDDELPATVVAQDAASVVDGILLSGENLGRTVGVGGLIGPAIIVRDNVTLVAGHRKHSGMQTNRCTEEIRVRTVEIKTCAPTR